ncbi:hypothetical protein DYD21_10105 [Rhodohalobacter sp. SW132]|uniref:hypothetical protein n=1 Tax=Rhodohalobacter sp. SW132 TaxID=2293433 RepID=UPI000E255DB9|nr:hypothetical protein [Rhodohalobacter sp. SW132]REL33749.1 hypothetical protein DYD21_10105 [Rhodohalobacter sp. SW132]
MNYEETKKQHCAARQQLIDAETKLDELESGKVHLMDSFQVSYETLTDERARKSIGEGSADSVKKAEKKNRNIKDKLEQVKTDIEVQKKAVSLLKDKFAGIDAAFKKQASQHYKNQSEPLFDSLTDALHQADKAIQGINEMAKSAEREGVTIGTKGIKQHSEILISKQRPAGMLAMNTINSKQLQQ